VVNYFPTVVPVLPGVITRLTFLLVATRRDKQIITKVIQLDPLDSSSSHFRLTFSTL
jgi:hypothetical protein